LNFSSLDDAALIHLISTTRFDSGEQNLPESALGELYDRYGRLIYTVAIHVVGDSETAEEITQDVFVRAWEGAHMYRPEMAKVSSWLVSIARHRSIDELRRRGARPENAQGIWFDDDLNGLLSTDGPESEVETAIQRHGVRRLVASLPPDQRKVLELAYFRGMSHSQISEFLGEPLGTVKSRIRMAMQRLRDELSEE